MTLDDLRPGQSATVSRVLGDGAAGRRVLEMGVVPGTPMALVAVAPLGDPLVFELRGYRLSLRRAEAAMVEVRPGPGGPPS